MADDVERKELCKFLLSRMNPAERTLIMLDYEEHSYQQIADTLRIDKDKIGPRLYTLRQKCERWRQEWDSGQGKTALQNSNETSDRNSNPASNQTVSRTAGKTRREK